MAGTSGGSGNETMGEEEGEWEYYDDDQVLPDFWQGFVDSGTDFKKPVESWLRYFSAPFENPYGWNMYREFWRVWVPLLLAPRHNTTSVDKLSETEERRIQEILLDTLLQFIAGTEQYNTVFDELTAQDTPSALCGYVFKNGDTCYNCRDCGQDATCVLCAKCFTHSEHKNHRYRMHTSEGGGICDCGDYEAFTSHYLCSIHEEQAKNGKSASQVLDSFPADLRQRALDILYTISCYVVNIVADFKGQTDLRSALKEQELFPDLRYPLKYSNYCTVLLNDENHSYNDVIRVLTKVLSGTAEKTIIDLTTYVDKFGKAVIKVGNYKECVKISSRIDSLTRIPHSTVLKSVVVPAAQIGHERFAALLLEWIPNLLNKSSGFRPLLSQVLMMDTSSTNVKIVRHREESKHSICEAVILNELNTWKQMRNLWSKVLIDGLMKDYESKKRLAVLFTSNYPTIVNNFITDDQERDASVMSLSVQIFTVPSLSLHLIEHCDAVSNLLQAFIDMLKDSRDEEDVLTLTSWLDEEKNEFSRILISLNDLTYLLGVVPTEQQWTPGLRTSFMHGVEKILMVLSMMQNMDGMVRQVGMHIEQEDQQWKLGYDLTTSYSEIVKLVVNWIKSDKQVLGQSLQITLDKIAEHTPKYQTMSKHLGFLGMPQMFEVLEFDVLQEKVSLHVPLHRFLVNLVGETAKYDLHSTILRRIENSLPLLNLVEPVLQVLVIISQINAGMWRRNGNQADSQAFIYNNRTFFPGIREADLLLLQVGAALTPNIDQYLVNILARFKLTKWVTGDMDTESVVRSEEFVEKCNALAEHWLNLVIAMVGERFTDGVGSGSLVSPRLELRRDILHLLCIEPLPHSVIVKRIPSIKDSECELDEILDEISELKSSTKNPGKKVYYLRSGLEEEYNMFFYGYSKEQQTAAQEYQLNTRLKKGDPCPPPDLPSLSPLFSGLERVLESSVLLQAVSCTLRRIADTSTSRSKYVLESHVHKVLFLVGLGLRQDASTSSSRFTSLLNQHGVIDLIQRMVNSRPDLPEHINKLASWILGQGTRRTEDRVEDMDTSEGSSDLLRKRRAEAAAARKAKILAQMSQMQKTFATENKTLLDSIQDDKEPMAVDTEQDIQMVTVCLGPQQTEIKEANTRHQCILCQEEESIGSVHPLVMAAYIQRTTTLSQVGSWNGSGERTFPSPGLHLEASRVCSPHVSSCGHIMHARCYQKYFDSQVAKERDRNINLITRNFMNYDVQDGEYTCPICERLSNTVLPVLPPLSSLRKKQSKAPVPELGLNTFVKVIKDVADSCTPKEKQKEGEEEEKEKKKDEVSCFLSCHSKQKTLRELTLAYGSEVRDSFKTSLKDDKPPVVEEMQNMMSGFCMAVYTRSQDVNPDEMDPRVPLLLHQAVSTTLLSLDLQLQQESKPLFGSLNTRDDELVRHLVRLIGSYPACCRVPYRCKVLQDNGCFLLNSMFGDGGSVRCVFDLDMFGLLVSLISSLPGLFYSETSTPPRVLSGLGLELNCLKICVLLQIVQILRGYPERAFVEFAGVHNKSENQLLQKVVGRIARQRQFSLDVKKMNYSRLSSRLEQDLVPLLRCSALLFNSLTDIPPGQQLSQDGGTVYKNLSVYLGLPVSLSLLLDTPAANTLLDSTLLNKPDSNQVETSPSFPLTFRRSVPCLKPGAQKQYFPVGGLTQSTEWRGGLIPLPRDYTELLHLASDYVCPNSVTGESKDPALCLICGVMVCSHAHCCGETIQGEKVGGCTAHAKYCGAGTGIFLKIRDCYIILLHKMYRGSIIPAPYLDQYGETDQRLKRGNPLYLEPSRYSELDRAWLRNDIPEKIARMFDPDVLLLVEWQQF